MTEFKKKKQFLRMPKYPGGSIAFKAFIARNLQYPKQALEQGVEGSVIVGYEVQDTGEVIQPHIIKGLGSGCDEEAIRLISLLQFEKVKNRGVRLRMSTKTTIHFRLPPGLKIVYNVTPPVAKKQSGDEKANDGQTHYEYTITF